MYTVIYKGHHDEYSVTIKPNGEKIRIAHTVYGVEHKGGFPSVESANDWVNSQGDNITPLRLMTWSEDIQCLQKVRDY